MYECRWSLAPGKILFALECRVRVPERDLVECVSQRAEKRQIERLREKSRAESRERACLAAMRGGINCEESVRQGAGGAMAKVHLVGPLEVRQVGLVGLAQAGGAGTAT